MIRQATQDDSKQIMDLVMIVLKDMELPLIDTAGEDKVKDYLLEAAQDPTYRYAPERILVYDVDGDIKGIAVGYPNEDEAAIDDAMQYVLASEGYDSSVKLFEEIESKHGEWYLDTLVTSPTYRKHGVGSKLLQALPDKAREDGKDIISLNVDLENPNAKVLYAKNGFEKESETVLSGHQYEHMHKKI